MSIDPHAFYGGLLIGSAAALLLFGAGRIAGVSGAVGGLVEGDAGPDRWRLGFVSGLLLAAWLAKAAGVEVVGVTLARWPVLLIAGLLVGIGTRLGNGCTSGHGVCGLGNLSLRSLLATMTFMGLAAATVFVSRHLVGGR